MAVLVPLLEHNVEELEPSRWLGWSLVWAAGPEHLEVGGGGDHDASSKVA